ncbi:MAG: hypothetical protein GY862_22880, partial [Gammaproteobacteria bacterium]|nr:hypothetical protein [Gammaproteobacteria bacterium]
RAGQDFPRYAEWIRAFDWNDFYINRDGGQYFECFRRELEDIADVVLIDSRTGVTEMSGVCTYQLADIVLMLVAPNQQNLDGTRMMAQSLANPKLIQEGRQGKPIAILPVPSRVDVAEGEFRNNFRVQFEDYLGEFLSKNLRFKNDAFHDFMIPHIPFYAYLEKVAAREPEFSVALDMSAAYESLAVALGQLEPEIAKKADSRKNIASVFEHGDERRKQLHYEPLLPKLELIKTLQKELEQAQATESQLTEELNMRVQANVSLEIELASVHAEKDKFREQARVAEELQQRLEKVSAENKRLEAQAQTAKDLKRQLANVTAQKQALGMQVKADRKKLEEQARRTAEDLKQRLTNITAAKDELEKQGRQDAEYLKQQLANVTAESDKLEEHHRRAANDLEQRLANVTAAKDKLEEQARRAAENLKQRLANITAAKDKLEKQARTAEDLKTRFANVTAEKDNLAEQAHAAESLEKQLVNITAENEKLGEQARAAEGLKQQLANITVEKNKLEKQTKDTEALKQRLANVTNEKDRLEEQARIAENLKQQLVNTTAEKEAIESQAEADRKKLEAQARRTAEDLKQRLANVTAEKEKLAEQVRSAKTLKEQTASAIAEKQTAKGLFDTYRQELKILANDMLELEEQVKETLANIAEKGRLEERLASYGQELEQQAEAIGKFQKQSNPGTTKEYELKPLTDTARKLQKQLDTSTAEIRKLEQKINVYKENLEKQEEALTHRLERISATGTSLLEERFSADNREIEEWIKATDEERCELEREVNACKQRQGQQLKSVRELEPRTRAAIAEAQRLKAQVAAYTQKLDNPLNTLRNVDEILKKREEKKLKAIKSLGKRVLMLQYGHEENQRYPGFYLSENFILTCPPKAKIGKSTREILINGSSRQHAEIIEKFCPQYGKEYAIVYLKDTLQEPFQMLDEKEFDKYIEKKGGYSYGPAEVGSDDVGKNNRAVKGSYYSRDHTKDHAHLIFCLEEESGIGRSGLPVFVFTDAKPNVPQLIGMQACESQVPVSDMDGNSADDRRKTFHVLPVYEVMKHIDAMRQRMLANITFKEVVNYTLEGEISYHISEEPVTFKQLNELFGLELNGLNFFDARKFVRWLGVELATKDEWSIAFEKHKIVEGKGKEWLLPDELNEENSQQDFQKLVRIEKIRGRKKIIIMDERAEKSSPSDPSDPPYALRIVRNKTGPSTKE